MPAGGGSYWQACNGGIRQDPVTQIKATEWPGATCCHTCGCFCIAFVAFPTDFCFHTFGVYTGLGHFPSTVNVACSPSDYPCIATPLKVFPATGGGCESPATGCTYSSTGYQTACSVCDQFRFHTSASPGDIGAIPLIDTKGPR